MKSTYYKSTVSIPHMGGTDFRTLQQQFFHVHLPHSGTEVGREAFLVCQARLSYLMKSIKGRSYPNQ
jgi:hypothetical protein